MVKTSHENTSENQTCLDCRVRLEKDLLATLEHSSQVTCLNLCSDNSQLVSGTRDGLVSRWCLLSRQGQHSIGKEALA